MDSLIDIAIAAFKAEHQLWVMIPHRDARQPAIARRHSRPQTRSRISSELPEKIAYEDFSFRTPEERDDAVLRASLSAAIVASQGLQTAIAATASDSVPA